MTARLEKAINRLAPRQIEELIQFAEKLANHEANGGNGKYLKLDWVGGAEEAYPEYRTGVDAANAATEMMRKSAEAEETR
jgi:hypothetical protein